MAQRSSAQEFETTSEPPHSETRLRWPIEASAARGVGTGRARRGALAGGLFVLVTLVAWYLTGGVRSEHKAPELSEARKALLAAAAEEPKPRVIMHKRGWPADEAAPNVQPEPSAQPTAAMPSANAPPNPEPAQPSGATGPANETASATEQAASATGLDPASDEASGADVLALRKQADRALAQRDLERAEQLYWRVLELEIGNPRATFGLARIRVAQGNLSGAEGLLQLAIRARPRRASYHSLYADVLRRLGRNEEALMERARAEQGVQDK